MPRPFSTMSGNTDSISRRVLIDDDARCFMQSYARLVCFPIVRRAPHALRTGPAAFPSRRRTKSSPDCGIAGARSHGMLKSVIAPSSSIDKFNSAANASRASSMPAAGSRSKRLNSMIPHTRHSSRSIFARSTGVPSTPQPSGKRSSLGIKSGNRTWSRHLSRSVHNMLVARRKGPARVENPTSPPQSSRPAGQASSQWAARTSRRLPPFRAPIPDVMTDRTVAGFPCGSCRKKLLQPGARADSDNGEPAVGQLIRRTSLQNLG